MQSMQVCLHGTEQTGEHREQIPRGKWRMTCTGSFFPCGLCHPAARWPSLRKLTDSVGGQEESVNKFFLDFAVLSILIWGKFL